MTTLKHDTIIGFLFVLITGTISHFVYELSGNNVILGFFFPVNESTWEHMKLVFFPMLLYTFLVNQKRKHSNHCIVSSLLFGILVGTLLIPVLFYTYSGILGYHLFFLDLSTFFISVLAAFWTAYQTANSCCLAPYTSLLKILVFIMTILFFVFTYFPPDIALFTSPTS